MTVEIEHVFYAEDAISAAAIMDNARMSGADEVRAEWMQKENVYRVEYTTPQEDESCGSA